jgi:hypothetical protein
MLTNSKIIYTPLNLNNMIHELSLKEVADVTGFDTVSEMIEEYAFDSVVPSCCSENCEVEPDGVCSHGHNSILVVFGII